MQNLERKTLHSLVALSLDGKYAAPDGSSRWITGESSRKMVHKLREEPDVILTGGGGLA